VLGDGIGVRAAARGERDAAPRQGGNVEVVVSRAAAARHAQVLPELNQLGCEHRLLHDQDHAVGLRQCGRKFRCGRGRKNLESHIRTRLQHAHARPGQLFGENEGSMFHEEES
jgi:hypothetical protein